jgi:hypothetical protein
MLQVPAATDASNRLGRLMDLTFPVQVFSKPNGLSSGVAFTFPSSGTSRRYAQLATIAEAGLRFTYEELASVCAANICLCDSEFDYKVEVCSLNWNAVMSCFLRFIDGFSLTDYQRVAAAMCGDA